MSAVLLKTLLFASCYFCALSFSSFGPIRSAKSSGSRSLIRSAFGVNRFGGRARGADVSMSGVESGDFSGYALLFDCDGVIVETEEMHRVAYNAAFDKYGLKLKSGEPVVWSVEYYDILQNTVGGGKPKMHHYFNNEVKHWPEGVDGHSTESEGGQIKLVDALQDAKVEAYKAIIDGGVECRPGIKELMDSALENPSLKVGICTAATKGGFYPLIEALLGQERLNKLDVLIVGDDVPRKKPDPLIYNTAKDRIGVSPENCVVIEDSMVGLRAAKGAGMNCIITYTANTASADFYGEGADAKMLSIDGVTLSEIFEPLKEAGAGATLLENRRDP